MKIGFANWNKYKVEYNDKIKNSLSFNNVVGPSIQGINRLFFVLAFPKAANQNVNGRKEDRRHLSDAKIMQRINR